MMTNRPKHLIPAGLSLLALLLFAPGCTEGFDELNTPDDEIVQENIDAGLLGQAFAQSQFAGLFHASGFQITQSLFSDLYAQYFATTAANFDSDQYVEVGGWANSSWNSFYSVAAPQLELVEDRTAQEGLEVQNAIAKVWRVEIYHRVTDYWGPIIYSEFGSGETSVAYDSQEAVYKNFFAVLDSARTVLDQHVGENAFGSNDQIYGGNVDQWLTFANSLQLRLAMRVRYVEPELAQQEAEEAVAAGVMTSNEDNAQLLTTPNSRNQYTIITDWGEFRMSSAMESTLEGFQDPRKELYYSAAVSGDSDDDGSPYEGMRNGLPRTQKGSQLNDLYSDMGTQWLNDNRGGTNPPIRIMSAAEVYFLRAEGALQGWAMGGSAEELYNEGIRMSLIERVDASEEVINAYIDGDTPTAPDDEWNSGPLSDIPVAFDTGGSEERKLEQIITQKWLSLYPNSMEAWAEHRRTGYPRLYPIIESMNETVAADETFRRMTFVTDEITDNNAAVVEARKLLDGEDNNSTRLWWDAKPLSDYPPR